MKVVFFVDALSQPRVIKRVVSIYNSGYEVEVYGHSRGFYENNDYPKEIIIHNLGWVKSGSGYIGKFFTNLIDVCKIARKYKSSDVIYYIFSFDYAFAFVLCSNKPFFYEISDIIYSYFESEYLRRMFKNIDKYLIRKSCKTVFTSAGFKKYLFGEENITNVIIQPNKVNPSLSNIKRSPLPFTQKTGLIFAYVGAFRYPNTVFRFAKVIGEHYPQHSFYFYGDSHLTSLAVELSSKYGNVKYWGSFKSPDDLERIYSNIDVVVACYDNTTINEQIAEPNKLYESICFCKPILVSEKTYLADRVRELQSGFVMNAFQDQLIVDFLDNLDLDQLELISKREYEMDQSQFIDSPSEILQALVKCDF